MPDLARADIIRFVAAAPGDGAARRTVADGATLSWLGHIFDERDVGAAVPEPLAERLMAVTIVSIAGVSGPEARLLGRDLAGTDLLRQIPAHRA